MITRKELEDYAKTRNIQNIGHTEKDYFQTVLLFIIYQSYGDELIFKGGTALSKCFGMPRFSEDLDFSSKEKIYLKKIEDGLKRFKIEYEIETEEYTDGLKITIRLKGPLYIGIKNSLCKLIIDISLREQVLLAPEIKTLGRHLEEIPAFDVVVMQQKEIFAEKIRAIMTRNKARDIYDLFFLLNNGISFDKNLAEEKLKYYKKSWTHKAFVEALSDKKEIWLSELSPLVLSVPPFDEVKRAVLKRVLEGT